MSKTKVSNPELKRAAFASLIGIATLFLPALCRAQVEQTGNKGYTLTAIVGQTGDGGFSGPAGLALDSSGNLYVADFGNSVVRKIAVNGAITTVAGSGSPGYMGDNGPATSAKLSFPGAVAVDTSGNLFIADSGNRVIRKVSAVDGAITTFAGGGPGCAQQTDSVGDACPATSAMLLYPSGVAVDPAGNLYISDTFDNRVREVLLNGVITTVAGTGSSGYSGDGSLATNASIHSPMGLALDSAGNLYIADTGNSVIRKITNGTITTVAGNGSQGFGSANGGPAVDAELDQPTGAAVDTSGNIYISDDGNSRILEVFASDGTIQTDVSCGINLILCSDPVTGVAADLVTGVAVDPNGAVYVADYTGSRILRATPPSFFSGEDALTSPFFYLQIPGGNLFGYYSYLSSSILYHVDLGIEAFIPSTANSIYFYDFASGHWWYSSASLFPTLYDFTLGTWIYYRPDSQKPGHYTNPRSFEILATGAIIQM